MPLSAAPGITLYWPIVCLVAMVDARDTIGWNIESETWIVCQQVVSWGLGVYGR